MASCNQIVKNRIARSQSDSLNYTLVHTLCLCMGLLNSLERNVPFNQLIHLEFEDSVVSAMGSVNIVFIGSCAMISFSIFACLFWYLSIKFFIVYHNT